MKKVISVLSLAFAASFTVNAASGDTSSATANWQGVIPGIAIPEGGFIVTAKDGERSIPIGQINRKPEGNLFGNLIDLEGHKYTPASEGVVPTPAVVGDLQPATWVVEEAKFYVGGVEVRGIAWNVYDNTDLLASIDTSGVVTLGTSGAVTTADSAIELTIESDSASNEEVDKYAGSEGAVSVTIIATSA